MHALILNKSEIGLMSNYPSSKHFRNCSLNTVNKLFASSFFSDLTNARGVAEETVVTLFQFLHT